MSHSIIELDLQSDTQLDAAFPVMRQLRPHLDRKQFGALVRRMATENYRLWAYGREGRILGLVSTRVYTDLVRGAHLYIDDLVTTEESRSQSIGAKLLTHAEALARELSLPSLRLCCALTNTGLMKFYEREGWTSRAYALVKNAT